MERKIGEIFEYNSEWYQCIECKGCDMCAFKDIPNCNGNIRIGECSPYFRNDRLSVIFKKLEKAGETYMVHGHIVQKYKFFHSPAIQIKGMSVLRTINSTNTIAIEIK